MQVSQDIFVICFLFVNVILKYFAGIFLVVLRRLANIAVLYILLKYSFLFVFLAIVINLFSKLYSGWKILSEYKNNVGIDMFEAETN